MKWHYTKDNDFPEMFNCGCLCDLIAAYEVLCYDKESNMWYDSWGDRKVVKGIGVEKWIKISDIEKEVNP